MDRYYWRTGQRWSCHYHPLRSRLTGRLGWTLLFLFAAYLVTTAILFLMR
jgi:hypothetical protein